MIKNQKKVNNYQIKNAILTYETFYLNLYWFLGPQVLNLILGSPFMYEGLFLVSFFSLYIHVIITEKLIYSGKFYVSKSRLLHMRKYKLIDEEIEYE